MSLIQDVQQNCSAKLGEVVIEKRLPLRLIFGGGWTDTPPYTLEVLNP
jgi:hypothetical protein